MATATDRVAEIGQLIREVVRKLLRKFKRDDEADLMAEFAAWEAASDEALHNWEAGVEELTERFNEAWRRLAEL
jgi:arginyl-tRNA synthetase